MICCWFQIWLWLNNSPGLHTSRKKSYRYSLWKTKQKKQESICADCSIAIWSSRWAIVRWKRKNLHKNSLLVYRNWRFMTDQTTNVQCRRNCGVIFQHCGRPWTKKDVRAKQLYLITLWALLCHSHSLHWAEENYVFKVCSVTKWYSGGLARSRSVMCLGYQV